MEKKYLILAVVLLIAFGGVVRLLPHAPNMTPIVALAFVGSLYFNRRWGLGLPLAVLFLSDLFIGFYDWKIMLSVYGSFALVGIVSWISKKFRGIIPLGLTVISASVLFFLITNAAVWAFSPWYEKSISGLLYAFELGLPFWRNMLVGDILYTALLVVVFELGIALSKMRKPVLNLHEVAEF